MISQFAMIAGFSAGMGVTALLVTKDDRRRSVVKHPFTFPLLMLGVSLGMSLLTLYLVFAFGGK